MQNGQPPPGQPPPQQPINPNPTPDPGAQAPPAQPGQQPPPAQAPPQPLPQTALHDMDGFKSAVAFFGLQDDPRYATLTGIPPTQAPAPTPAQKPTAEISPELQTALDANKMLLERLDASEAMNQQSQINEKVLMEMKGARFKDKGAESMFMGSFLAKFEVTPEGLVKSKASGAVIQNAGNSAVATLSEVIQSEVALTPYLFQTGGDWSHPVNPGGTAPPSKQYFMSLDDIKRPGFMPALKKTGQYAQALEGQSIDLGAVEAAIKG